MANVLKMAIVQSILSLHAQGWSGRRIARTLNIGRETVSRYVRLAAESARSAPAGSSNPAIAPIDPAGSVGAANEASAPIGAETGPPPPNPAIAPIRVGRAGPPSQAAAWQPFLLAQRAEGLSYKRIHQDLQAQPGAEHVSYDSVRRFLKRHGARPRELPFRRMECAPGEEAQVDFGSGAPVISCDGKRRKTHVFRVVLSHSRKAYSEATYRQTSEDFIRCLENAFAHFGGVPQTLVIDNLRAAVAHPDWFDPELNPKLQSFCEHYGTVILPTKPYTPRHKGKIERGIGYVKDNGLKGHTFRALEEENRHLLRWEASIADTRIHGTTKRQVGKVFREVERAALRPLPPERFPFFHEAQRKVSRDGHIEVAKSYYSVPPEYLSRTVWARWDGRLVRVFNHRFEQIAMHVRREPGRFSTQSEHLAPEKISSLERGAKYLLDKAGNNGPLTRQWAEAMLAARGIEGTRVLQGLVSLARKQRSETLEKACQVALAHGAFRLRTIRKLLAREATAQQQPLPFLEEHPIIRPLDNYARVVSAALQRQQDRSSLSEGFKRHDSGVRGGDRKSPGGIRRQGSGASSTRPRSGYPSPGCSSAEPGSVSPDSSSVVPLPPFQQEHDDE